MKVEHCCKDLLAMALRVRQATRELVDGDGGGELVDGDGGGWVSEEK